MATSWQDPYRSFKFEVECEAFVRAGFSKISGFSETTEDIEYREGGENETPHHLPGQTKFGDITLERGISRDEEFVQWRQLIFNVFSTKGVQPPNDNFRKDLTVYLKDKAGNRVKQWNIKRAWPKEFKVGDLDANANDVEIETMVLANEGWEVINLAID
jgi:phage tail-like protein